MDIEELSDHFDQVKMSARGFTALCPSHPDTTPSLSIDEGRTWYVVSCRVGCDFKQIAADAGLRVVDFKIGSTYSPTPAHSNMKARDRMRKMRESKGRVLTDFHQIADVALSPPQGVMRDVGTRWFNQMNLGFEDAMAQYAVTMDGPVFDLLYGRSGYTGSNWTDEKREIGRLLWQTWRKHGPR